MLYRFVCALLSFCAQEFPVISKPLEPGKLLCNAPSMRPKDELQVGRYPWSYCIEVVSHLLWVATSGLHYKHEYEFVFYLFRYGLMLSYLGKLYKNQCVYPTLPHQYIFIFKPPKT